ncbi:Ribokinase-like protein [Punctularia strigosozonata HHB-11173 SS5]|uniref:Ribokinase-like protein n=1 Tax=Punctularia strigosozonata (strain HHB-11173) TaxID=741275 RepID=UPI00044169D9|nr:Ribokinase-like protein [Punctularia strigosozonata HHB-11173 SS5]EIN06237.1 Ribokinase-like protein [Punctularia strigosozonata HHB-11173 SS5]
MASDRVLSIQSHVAFGYVGGKAAVFPLQCLGYDVDVVNTVNFSNHSGYGRFGGSRTNAAELKTIFDIMSQNGLLRPSRLLTGYIPGGEAVSAVAELAERLRKENPDLIYLLDPVLGDAGKLYVAPDVIPIYRSMLPLSTIITPNWFEVETLTEVEIKDPASLKEAFRVLHETYGVPHAVMSSIPLKGWLLDILSPAVRPPDHLDDEYLLCISSSAQPTNSNSAHPSVVHAHCVPLIPGYFSGVGDLFSALVLAHFTSPTSASTASPATTPLSRAVALALAKTHAVLSRTQDHFLSLPEDERIMTDDEKDQADPNRRVTRMRGRELRLVQSQDIIRGDLRLKDGFMGLWGGFWDLC